MKERIDYYQDITKFHPEGNALVLKRMANSTFLFVICFSLAVFINYLISALAASVMGYQPVLYYFGIENIPLEHTAWNQSRIILYHLSGPIVVLFLGLISLRIHIALRKSGSILKPATLWFAFCSILLFLCYITEIVFGTESYSSPFYFGFSVVASWFWMGKVIMAPISLVGFVLTLAFGYMITPFFLELSSSATRIQNLFGKRAFVFQNVILPFIKGAALIMVFRADKDFVHSICILFSISIAIFVIWLRSSQKIMGLKIVKSDSLNHSIFILLVLLIGLFAGMHYFLDSGIRL